MQFTIDTELLIISYRAIFLQAVLEVRLFKRSITVHSKQGGSAIFIRLKFAHVVMGLLKIIETIMKLQHTIFVRTLRISGIY